MSKKILFILGLILLIYVFDATEGTFHFKFNENFWSRYNLLSRAFMKGKLDLLVQPPQELLQLSNPYDPVANRKFRHNGYQDLSLYDGKLYLYFGPVPALVLYMPFYFLTKHELSDILAILIFMYGTLIWATLILFHLKYRYFKGLPNWVVYVSIFVIAFANSSPFLFQVNSVYNVAIASGCFFLTGALYFFIQSQAYNPPNKLFLAIASLFLGFATGSRFFLLLTSVVLILFVWIYFSKTSKLAGFNYDTFYRLALILPFLFCLICLLKYNAVRFNNSLENGSSYQLTTLRCKLFYPESIRRNLYCYLLLKPAIESKFPFVSPLTIFVPSESRETEEPMYGLFLCVPFVLLTIMYSLLYILGLVLGNEAKLKSSIPFPAFEFSIIFIAFFLNFIFLIVYQYVTLRYHGDYLTYLLLCSCIMWFYFKCNSGLRSGFLSIFIPFLFAFISILFGFVDSIKYFFTQNS